MKAASVAAACLFLGGCHATPQVEIGSDWIGTCAIAPIDPWQQTALGPTDRSHWLQPWRGYLDTWPATRMLAAAGITVPSTPERLGPDPDLVPRLLAAAGFSRAYIELQWSRMSFDDPQTLEPQARAELATVLGALRRHGLRPLILLYGYVGNPVPGRLGSVTLQEPAPAGARTLRMAATEVASVVPGRTGLSGLTGYKAAEVLFTAAAPDGAVTLSKPLPKDLPAGAAAITTLAFEPFFRPERADGTPEPRFEATMRGYEAYVTAVVREARAILGDDAFDVELWNEVGNGSEFLHVDQYYTPGIDTGRGDPAVVIPRAIGARTAAAVAALGPGYRNVRIGYGFANTVWSESAATVPAGLAALDRHVSVPGYDFPGAVPPDVSRGVDALGNPSGTKDAAGVWTDAFTPRYRAHFPELPLTAVLPFGRRNPGQLVRDLSPIVTMDERGTPHGRTAGTAVWLTALSTIPPAGLPAAERARFNAKAVLRALSAYASKGAESMIFYAPNDTDRDLVDERDPTGGLVLEAVRRFLNGFRGGEPITIARALAFTSVGGCGPEAQFVGDGTAAHPDLRDRDLVAFFPFQRGDKSFVASTYVMTRDLGVARAPSPFELAVEGLDGRRVLVEARDPLDDAPVEVTVLRRDPRRVVITLPLTDSPRLVTFTEP